MSLALKAALAAFIGAFIGAYLITCASGEAKADSWAYPTEGDNIALMQEIANTLADVSIAYGTGTLEVTSAWMDPRTYAVANGYGIVVNKVWSTGSIEALNAAMDADAASGWGNGGCSGIRSLTLHEAAHIIDGRQGWTTEDEAQALFGSFPVGRDRLSGYSLNPDGSVNYREAVAEAFQAVNCGTADAAEWDLYWLLVQ